MPKTAHFRAIKVSGDAAVQAIDGVDRRIRARHQMRDRAVDELLLPDAGLAGEDRVGHVDLEMSEAPGRTSIAACGNASAIARRICSATSTGFGPALMIWRAITMLR